MKLRLGLSRFVRNLSADRSERRRLGAAVVRLLHQRRRSLLALGPLLRIVPTGGKPKLQLWQAFLLDSIPSRYGTLAWPNFHLSPGEYFISEHFV